MLRLNNMKTCNALCSSGRYCSRRTPASSYCFQHQKNATTCLSRTKRGTRCMNRTRIGESYCHLHKPPGFLEKRPDICPVCIETFSSRDTHLECGHWIHISCVVKSGKPQCPICRQTLTYFSPEHRREMSRIKNQRRIEDVNEMTFSLMQEFIGTLIEEQQVTELHLDDDEDIEVIIDNIDIMSDTNFSITATSEGALTRFLDGLVSRIDQYEEANGPPTPTD
jgi:hypothetical protein